MRISDWSSDVCSSDLSPPPLVAAGAGAPLEAAVRQGAVDLVLDAVGLRRRCVVDRRRRSRAGLRQHAADDDGAADDAGAEQDLVAVAAAMTAMVVTAVVVPAVVVPTGIVMPQIGRAHV